MLTSSSRRRDRWRRELLPRSQWRDWGGDEIERILPFIDVIDAAWLLKLANGEVMPERGIVPAWQDGRW